MSTTPLTGATLHARFAALTEVLLAGRPLWSTEPFRRRSLDWEADHPALSAWLRALPEARLFPLEADPFTTEAPEPWASFARRIPPLIEAGPLPATTPLDARHPLARRVRGRKWDQVRGFLAAVEAQAPPAGPIVEWCSGRGNLGRTLAQRLGRPGLLLERDPALCSPPGDAPERPGVRHVCVDVRSPAVLDALTPDGTFVALHACGGLTDRVLEVACTHAGALLVAPCCLHRLHDATVYSPRSAYGRAHDPRLSHDDLRVATREACHAGVRRTRLRGRELILRSAWDLLLREVTGVDAHHPLPQMVRTTFDLPLADFVARMAALQGRSLPPFDAEALERRARARVHEVRALELPRLLFRRAMELWVDLDRATWLETQGWMVAVGTFCGVEASPRNLAICGTRA